MIKPDMIPDEVFYAFQKAWADKSTLSTKECLAAALQAWPGAFRNDMEEAAGVRRRIILPLAQTQEDGDGK